VNYDQQKAILYKLSLKGVSITRGKFYQVKYFQELDCIGIFATLQAIYLLRNSIINGLFLI